jgi:hypothetical protein
VGGRKVGKEGRKGTWGSKVRRGVKNKTRGERGNAKGGGGKWGKGSKDKRERKQGRKEGKSKFYYIAGQPILPCMFFFQYYPFLFL